MENLKRIRKARGLSQRALADRAGVVKSTIYEAEAGRHVPRIQTLEKIADALDVDLVDLLPSRKDGASV